MDALTRNWYTAYTLSRFEKKICADLQKQRIEAYLPRQRVTRKWSDRLKTVDVPLFPNYVFIRIADFKRHAFVNVKGIVSFVSFEGRPAQVTEEEINMIKRLEEQRPNLESTLFEGTKVRIIRGPLAGLEGRLFRRSGKCRFAVRIETIKQSLSVEVPSLYLEEI